MVTESDETLLTTVWNQAKLSGISTHQPGGGAEESQQHSFGVWMD